MSSDSHNPATDPEAARALGRWLDRAEGPAPEGLDSDVVEAIYALKPDLAPAPRVSADEILATVQRGPLSADPQPETPASASRDGAEIVPFPAPDTEPSEASEVAADLPPPRTSRRVASWASWTTMAGFAMLAAATVLVVLTQGRPETDLASSRGTPELGIEAEDLVAAAPSPEEAAEPTVEAERELSDAPRKVEITNQVAEAEPAPTAAPTARSAAAPTSATASARARPAGDAAAAPERQQGVYDIARDAVRASDPPIAEVAAGEGVSTAGPESREALAPSEGDELEEEEAAQLRALGYVADDEAPSRSRAATTPSTRPAVPRPSGTAAWRKGVDDATATEVEGLLASAEGLAARGESRGAAEALAGALRGPPEVAHHLAMRSGELFLKAGDAAAATRVLERGLAFAGGDPAYRRYLTLLLGDAAYQAGDAAQAEAHWARLR